MVRLRVPPGADETPASFVSRLAANHGLAARDFCSDWEVQFQRIVDGDRDAVAEIADLGGVSAEALMSHAFVRMEDRSYLHRGQILVRDVLRRSHVHVCPACCLADIATAPALRPAIAPYGRAAWLIEAVRTCPIHRIALTEIAHDPTPSRLHDFACLMAPAVAKLDVLLARAPRRDPFGLENYIFGRLDGVRQAAFLDNLPLYVAIRCCEMIGAVAEFGRTANLKRLTDDDWWRAGGAGFEIAAGGVETIGAFLTDLQKTYSYARSGREGPQALYGRLYQWLAFGAKDPAYNPLRQLIADHVRTHLPLGPGDEIFGKPVRRRTLHSIRSLAVETGLHPKTLRKRLKAAGTLDGVDPALVDQNTNFPAEAAILAVSALSSSVGLRGAGQHLGAPRVHSRLLAKHGFIKPRLDARAHGGENRYAIADLDEFLGRLFQDAKPVRRPKSGQVSIPAAAKRACCSAAIIVQLVLDRKLAWVGRAPDKRGYLAILVDAAEIKEKTRGPDHKGHTQRDVAALLGTTDRVIRALMKNKLLTTFVARDPVNHCPATLIHPDEFARFTAEYVTLFGLARERGRHFRRLLKELDAQGIEPTFDRDKIGTRIYRRRDVEVDNRGEC